MTNDLHKQALCLIDNMKGRIHNEDAHIVESLLETCIAQRDELNQLKADGGFVPIGGKEAGAF